MSRDADQITLTCFAKLEAPNGDVRLCDGGFVYFEGEKYEAQHDIYGTIQSIDEIEASFGDLAEGGDIVFSPNPDAALTDWFRADLENSRLRIWIGEIAEDGKNVVRATQIADRLVNTAGRDQNPSGEDLLPLSLIGRAQKLFLVNEGNVCSERFHKSVWPGENGFNNCIDNQVEVAWGVASSPNGTTSGGRGRGSFGGSTVRQLAR
ncbi:MAG: hypothetical protein WA908_01460 [Pontixanthobacter sp.]